MWVHHNMIRELGVQFSSDRSVSSVGHVLLHTKEDNRSLLLLSFPSQPWGCGLETAKSILLE